MTTLRIRRLNARYHLPSSRYEERARLDRVLQTMLDEPLERALEHAGVSPHEHVCIRRLDVSVRLRLSSPDSALGLAWSRALGQSIARARDGHGAVDVVRYSSMTHLLLDIAIGVATERFERGWAWRMSGVWKALDAPSPSEAAEELVSTLLERPHTIVPVLAATAGPGMPRRVFAALWRRLSDEQWVSLSAAALMAAGGPVHLIEDAAVSGVAEVASEARRVQSRSVFARAIDAAGAGARPLLSLERRRALAVLMLLESDPAAARDGDRARHLVGTLADACHPAATAAAEAALAEGSGHANRSSSVSEDVLPPAVTRRVATRSGGVLFLLNLLGPLDLVTWIQDRRGRRSFRWVLHQLAMAVCPGPDDDAAVLAFAGLSPDAVPPGRDEEPPTEEERHMVRELAAVLVTALDDRIEERPALSFVCHREAVVVADPGWIDVRFAFRDAATSIRRAGLDLNPGHLPWLGTVVVFSYE